jgi:DNA-binding transcriptional regulator LsrR (DeoR family)
VSDARSRSRELLVKAARMYFLDGRSQDDIARVLGTSRSNVSRMLRVARELGIVEIRIQDERDRDADLERALAERFGLSHVRVALFRPHQDAAAAAGELAAEWLDRVLRDGHILGLSGGTALRTVVDAVAIPAARRVEIVPLVGALTPDGARASGQELARELAGRLGGSYRYLHGPALLHSGAVRAALLAEPSIDRVVARARSADVAMVGIGTIGSGATAAVLDGLHLTESESRAFGAQEPVGDICCRFFDAQGRPVTGAAYGRVLGVDLADLRRIPTVVAVATGAEKTVAVLGALRGGLVTGLVTDAALAHAVLTAEGVL